MEYPRIQASISLDAVEANFEAMHRNLTPGTQVVAVIKADAYGHGAIPIAHLVEDYGYIWGFAVATAEEALSLRASGIEKPILILGLVPEETILALLQNAVRITVSTYELAEKCARIAQRESLLAYVHLAVDTGMSRIGFADQDSSIEVVKRIATLPSLAVEGAFTHFARADETDIAPAKEQLERFTRFCDKLQQAGVRLPLRHCSNSAGIIRLPEANLSMVRAGITIYGIYPSLEVERDIVPLQPVMELRSRLSFVKYIEPGTAVSYGGTYVAKERVRVGTVPVGYADGYPRLLSGKGYVLIHGKKAPILGRVCMDQFMVDVSDIPEAEVGTPVTLMGRDGDAFLGVEELGELSGRFPYEFVCCISQRVPRVYYRNGKPTGRDLYS